MNGDARISYAGAPVRVRDDLLAAHQRAWEHLASPGSWWSGEERVALAGEARAARTCELCRARAAALSPAAIGGGHESRGVLPVGAVEAVHRISSDPGRLTKPWFDRLRSDGLREGHYVELLGVVVTIVSIDAFCRGLGVAPHPLPQPRPGEPSHYRPAASERGDAWVSMLPNGPARGGERDLWEGKRTANVIRALSLVPDEVRNLRRLSAAHYLDMKGMMDLRAGTPALDRRQVELLAGRVSALRECFY